MAKFVRNVLPLALPLRSGSFAKGNVLLLFGAPARDAVHKVE
jgi:hypothetical protein